MICGKRETMRPRYTALLFGQGCYGCLDMLKSSCVLGALGLESRSESLGAEGPPGACLSAVEDSQDSGGGDGVDGSWGVAQGSGGDATGWMMENFGRWATGC